MVYFTIPLMLCFIIYRLFIYVRNRKQTITYEKIDELLIKQINE